MAKKKHRSVVSTEEEVLTLCEVLAKAPEIGFDTESSGAGLVGDKFMNVEKSTMVGFSLACDRYLLPPSFVDRYKVDTVVDESLVSWYVPTGHYKDNLTFNHILKVLDVVKGHPKVWAHNWKHDIKVVSDYLHKELWYPQGLRDSQITSWLGPVADKPYGLKKLARTVLGLTEDQVVDFDGATSGKPFHMLTPVMGAPYARQDAEITLMLGRKTETGIPSDVLSWEHRAIPAIAAMERRGISFDFEAIPVLSDYLESEVNRLERKWYSFVPGVDYHSNKQVADFFFGTGLWRSDLAEKTSTGGYSVNAHGVKKQLDNLRSGPGRDCAAILTELRLYSKLLSTYTWSVAEKANQYPDRRLRPSYSQTGTETGRLSSSYPNGQNFPSRGEVAKRVQTLFCAAPGNLLVSADFSQIEYRILAHMCGGELARAYQEGLDMHQKTGELLGLSRHEGKTMNFALVYGRSPQAVAGDLNVTVEEAEKFIKSYFEKIPETRTIKNEILAATKAEGASTTLTGRKRYFLEAKERGYMLRSEQRQAFNAVIQGTAADICKRAMVLAHEAGLPMNNQIHDDIRLECPATDAKDMARELQRIMESSYELSVPLKADPVIGKNWKELKDE